MAGHVIYTHTTIPAPPEVVWDVLTDVEHADSFLRSVRNSHLLTEGEYGVGTRWTEDRTMFGHRGTEEHAVTECEKPRRMVTETVLGGSLGTDVVHQSIRVSPYGLDGKQCRLSMTTTVDMSHRTIAGKAEWAVFGGHAHEHTRKLLQHDVDDIGREVERRVRGVHAA